MNIIDEIIRVMNEYGDAPYGDEPVTQKEHALQAAWLAQKDGAPDSLVAAALLHDIGHMAGHLPSRQNKREKAHGLDDHHEDAGWLWLRSCFGPDVTQPVRLHVAAKRYICAVEPDYMNQLSPTSLQSLRDQGGPMTSEEQQQFEARPHWEDAVRLRRWDDTAKIPELPTPDLHRFREYLVRTQNPRPA